VILYAKIVKEILERGLDAAKNKFGNQKVKKAYEEMQKEGFDFQDIVKGKGAFKDFTIKDKEALDKLSATKMRKVRQKKEREYQIKETKKKFDKATKDLKDIPLGQVLGAGAAAESGRRVLEKARGGAVNKRKPIDGIAIKGFTKAKHR
jgi:hypothetical protein|tara:strand:- start:3346 stop:3792 length:447 start_codon:yes stop_codon:yes gene_type:complete